MCSDANPARALACAMLALKLVETETRRDARAAICIRQFRADERLLFDSSLGFTLMLFAALALFLATLARTGAATPDAPLPNWRQMRRAQTCAAAPSPCSRRCRCALCVFVFLPRLGSPLWGAPTDTRARAPAWAIAWHPARCRNC